LWTLVVGVICIFSCDRTISQLLPYPVHVMGQCSQLALNLNKPELVNGQRTNH